MLNYVSRYFIKAIMIAVTFLARTMLLPNGRSDIVNIKHVTT